MGVNSKPKLKSSNPLFEESDSHSRSRHLTVPHLSNKFGFMGMFSHSTAETRSRDPHASGKFKGTLRRKQGKIKKSKRGSSLISVVSNLEQAGQSSVQSLLKLQRRNKHASTDSLQSKSEETSSAPTRQRSSKKAGDRNAPPTARHLEQNEMCRKAGQIIRSLIERAELQVARCEILPQEDDGEVPPNMDGDNFGCSMLLANEPLLSCCKGKKVPSIDVDSYVIRLVKYTNIWMEEEHSIESTGIRTLAVALIYIDRIIAHNNFKVTVQHIHRLLMGTFLLAIKMFEDQPISNRFWSQVGGVDLTEVNEIEGKICEAIRYNLNVDLVLMEDYLEGIDHVLIK